MENFREFLEQKRVEKGFKKSHIGEHTGCNTVHVTRLLNGSREVHPKRAYKIIEFICDDVQLSDEIFHDYSLTLRSPMNIRSAMEYAATRSKYNLLKLLIEKHECDRNAELEEFCRVYKILYKYYTDELGAEELYRVVKGETSIKYGDAKIMIRLLECYSLLAQKHYDFLMFTASSLIDDIELMEDPFFKRSYKVRYMEFMVFVKLRVQNDIKTARHMMKELIKTTDSEKHKAFGFNYLALSYLFEEENYDKYMKYMGVACKKYEKLGFGANVIKHNIQFAQILHNKELTCDYENEEIKAFHLAVTGETEQAINVINEYEAKHGKTAETVYFRAIATKEVNLYWESLSMFKSRGDKFLSRLSRNALIELGENEIVVDLFFNQKN